jgi:hypothetical protein
LNFRVIVNGALNAESCFESRASRLLDKSLRAEEKTGLLTAHVPAEKRKACETLARHRPQQRPLLSPARRGRSC